MRRSGDSELDLHIWSCGATEQVLLGAPKSKKISSVLKNSTSMDFPGVIEFISNNDMEVEEIGFRQ